MIVKLIISILLMAGLKFLYSPFTKITNVIETPVDTAWWQGLSEEWKNILIINQNFQKQKVDLFKLQDEYMNRLNAAGEAGYSEMNRSLQNLVEDRRFGLGYAEMYARAIRNHHMLKNEGIDLATLSNLETLYMVNGPGDLSPLRKLTHLKILIINYCGFDNSIPGSKQVLNLEPVESLKELRVLHCSSNALQSLSAIKNLVALEELRCENSSVSSLAPLKKLVNLKRLTTGSAITDLSTLSSLGNLEELNIVVGKQMPDLRKMKKLRALYIREGELSIVDSRYRINDIDFLASLTSLEYIDLNATSYHGRLDQLSALPHLKAVTLPPVNQETMLEFKNNHKNCIIINSFQYER